MSKVGSRRKHRFASILYRPAKELARRFIKSEGILFILALVIVAVGLGLGFQLGDLLNVKIVTAVLLTIPVAALAGFARKQLLSHMEDGLKLSEDYDALVQRYALANLIELDAFDESGEQQLDGDGKPKKMKLPVARELSIRGAKLVIEDDDSKQYQPPAYCSSHFDDIMKAHSASDVYNQENIRVDSWGLEGDAFVMRTSRTAYFFSLITNRAMDYRCNDTPTTVRELFEPGPRLRSLDRSVLSNHLGFNGFLESANGEVPLVKRDASLSVGKRTYGPSVAASLKVKYALDGDGTLTVDTLYEAMYREIRDELCVVVSDLVPMRGGFQVPDGEERNVAIVGAYRDVVEGGKPQFLIAARSSLCSYEIERQFALTAREKAKDKGEKAAHVVDGGELAWVPAYEVCAKNIRRVEEGHFVLKSSTGIYPLTPSAAASVVLYGEYRDAQGDLPK